MPYTCTVKYSIMDYVLWLHLRCSITLLQIPYPPTPTTYTGNFSCPFAAIFVNIYTISKTLYADISFGTGSTKLFYKASLKYYSELELQVHFVTSQMDCLFGEALALNNAWLYFDQPSSSKISPGFYFPILQCKMTRNP